MKNNLLKLFIITVVVLAVSKIGLCETASTVNLPPLPISDAVPAQTHVANFLPPELISIAIKFGKVMLGVVIASVVIYIVLLLWNLVILRSRKSSEIETSLSTPKNIDQAILFFIKKNKLK